MTTDITNVSNHMCSILIDRVGLFSYAESIGCKWEFGIDCRDCSESPVYVYFRDKDTDEVKERIELALLAHIRMHQSA